MSLCPKCKNEKMVLHKSSVYFYCKKCTHIEYDEPMSLALSKSFDMSKLEVEGAFYLDKKFAQADYSTGSSLAVVVLKYGKTLLYIPPMGIKDLRDLNEELFKKVEAWFPFSFNRSDFENNSNVSSTYYSHKRELLPRYKLGANQKMYNILTFNNRLSAKKYHLVYAFAQLGEKTYLAEHVYQKNDVVALDVLPYRDYRYVVSSHKTSHTIIDLLKNETHTISSLERITDITKDYIFGWNSRWDEDYSIYLYKVIRKSDKKVLFYNNRGHDNGCHLIGNRYFADNSYQDGMLDLLTGTMINYPFGNTCLDFVCDVNESGFTNHKGRQLLKNLPDVSWIGYDNESFFKKYHGFIPQPYNVGHLSIGGTGGYEQHNRKVFVVKNISEGLFYPKGKKLVNVKTENFIDVDETLLKWIRQNENVYVYDKKPKDLERVSVLQALEKGKQINGLSYKYGSLRYFNGRNQLKTNFLKSEIVFNNANILDVFYYPKKETFDIICKVNGNKVTFETNKKFERLEVAAIA